MRPTNFKPQREEFFLFTSPGGSVDPVNYVQIREANDGTGEDVVDFIFMSEHGTGLKIGRIERDTETELAFTVKDPPDAIFEGVVIFTRAPELDGSDTWGA